MSKNSALVLIQMQNDHFPNGRTPMEKSVEAVNKAQPLLQAFRDNKQAVIHVQHISTLQNATAMLPCTRGADFHPSVTPQKGETIVKTHYPNSFKDTQLLNHLIKNQINHLIICGMTTHLAIDATVRAACDLGFTCTVIHDACTAKQLEFNHTVIPAQNVHLAFIAALQPTYASVLSADEYLQKIGARTTVAA